MDKITSLPNIRVKKDRSHVWGDYLEYRVSDELLFRSIRIFEGAMNSLHMHETSEVMLIESGSIKCWLGEYPDSVEVKVLKEGDSIFVPERWWHRIEFVSGDFAEQNVPFSQIVELMFGNNQYGQYNIQRVSPAVPGRKPGKE